MPEVLLSNDDVTVLGPPSTVEVLVDIGPSGTRGSQVFVGVGDPNIVEIGQTGDTWIQILEINPTIYSENHLTTYAAGEGQVVIPIADIVTVTGTPLTAANFNVQYSIAHDNPIASSMSIPALAGAGDDLVINFKAVEHRSDIDSGPYGDWALLTGEVTTHLFISIVAADEES